MPGVRRGVVGLGTGQDAVLLVSVPGSGVAAGSWASLKGRGGAREPRGGVPGVREQLGIRTRTFALGGLLQPAMPYGRVASAGCLSTMWRAVA